jgi:hypothetical protein
VIGSRRVASAIPGTIRIDHAGKGGVEHRAKSLGSIASRNDRAVLGGGDGGYSRESSGSGGTTRDDSDRLWVEHRAKSLGSIASRPVWTLMSFRCIR